ncbi:MAG: hypothetical protein ABGY21_00130, partial [Pseudomonadota bacterium]
MNHNDYMQIALDELHAGVKLGLNPVGSIIVRHKDGEIIGRGRNLVPIHNDPIVDIHRNEYSRPQISLSESKWANDTTSLKKSTAISPVYWIKNDGVQIAPDTDGSNLGYVFYVNYDEVDDDRIPNAAATNPRLRVYSADDTAAGDYIEIYHDQANETIATSSDVNTMKFIAGRTYSYDAIQVE